MLGPEVRNRIRQLNPWMANPDMALQFFKKFLPAQYVQRIAEKNPVETDRASLIIGPRQSGKSTLVWHFVQQFTPHIIFLNMEDPLLRSALQSPFDFLEYLQKDYSSVKALFIDEIQHMEEAGLFVKGLVDAKIQVPIWVTGSSSFDLRSKTRESLAGRATRVRLLPFSHEELMNHANPPNVVAARYLSEEIVKHQLIFGSFPAVYLSGEYNKKISILSDLVEALVLRDISDIFRIKRVDAFRKLLTLLAAQIGNLVNLSELSSVCNVSVGTISGHIEVLEESHITKVVQPFVGGKRHEIIGTPKIFFIDNGIRNQLLNNFSPELDLRTDNGMLFENWAFAEIYKTLPLQGSIKFWRSKAHAEVDFIIEYADKIFPVEVKFSSMKKPKLSRSAHSFIDVYHPELFVVLNLALEEEFMIEKTLVIFITPYMLAGSLTRFFETI